METSSDRIPTHRAWLVLGVIVVLSTALRFFLSRFYFGFLTGDDVEIIEAAFRQAFALDYNPWPIRNLFVPYVVVAPFLKLLAALGVSSADQLIPWASFPFIVFSALSIVLVYSIGSLWSADRRVGLLGAAIYGFHWIPLVYGSNPYPRTISTTCLLGAAFLITRFPTSRAAFSGGLLVAIAFSARYSEIIYLVPIATIAFLQARRFIVAICAGAAIGVALLCGLFDFFTWGSPFHSLMQFANYTLIEQASSSRVKDQAFHWYFSGLHEWIVPATWPFLYLAARKRALPRAWLFFALPVLALSLIHHKELRYLQAVIPFVAIISAWGFVYLQTTRRALAVFLLILSVLWNLTGIRRLEKKSMAATRAMQAIAIGGAPCVAVPQAWAFGDQLFVKPGTDVREIGVHPDRGTVSRGIADCHAIALYRSEMTTEVRDLLKKEGFREAGQFEWRRSRPVVAFERGD